MKICGIDLAGKPKNKTSLAFIENDDVKIINVFTDDEILEVLKKEKPVLVCIDAPLTKPKEGLMRECDKKLRKYGALPPLMKGMAYLTERGNVLGERIRSEGFKVIEVFSRATQKILGVKSQKDLIKMGLKGDVERKTLDKDEMDAVLAAITGKLHTLGKTDLIGGVDGWIIVPTV